MLIQAPPDAPPKYASQGVRDKTQELASYALEPESVPRSYSTASHESELPAGRKRRRSRADSNLVGDARDSFEGLRDEVIVEDSEPTSPEPLEPNKGVPSESPFTTMNRSTNRSARGTQWGRSGESEVPELYLDDTEAGGERQTLLPKARLSRSEAKPNYGSVRASEDGSPGKVGAIVQHMRTYIKAHSKSTVRTMKDPETWSSRAFKQYGMNSLRMASAVFLGLLLNVLDGLSYGKSIVLSVKPQRHELSAPERLPRTTHDITILPWLRI